MKLIAISVCVNYADFFSHVAKENKGLFDRWIIVTDTKDLKTKEICDKEGLECLQTDAFYENGKKFNKYAGIRKAIELAVNPLKDEWILFIDSDIALHHLTRRVLDNLRLEPHKLYGVDRLNISGLKAWLDYKAGRGVLLHNWQLNHLEIPVGSRLVHYYGHEGENGRFEGWRPCGFFQLCHASAFFNFNYPSDKDGADNCDLQFARQWPRHCREFIPEFFALHLESYKAGKAVNWYGRKSKPFDELHPGEIIKEKIFSPDPPDLAKQFDTLYPNSSWSGEHLIEMRDKLIEVTNFNKKEYSFKEKISLIWLLKREIKRLIKFIRFLLWFIFHKHHHHYH